MSTLASLRRCLEATLHYDLPVPKVVFSRASPPYVAPSFTCLILIGQRAFVGTGRTEDEALLDAARTGTELCTRYSTDVVLREYLGLQEGPPRSLIGVCLRQLLKHAYHFNWLQESRVAKLLKDLDKIEVQVAKQGMYAEKASPLLGPVLPTSWTACRKEMIGYIRSLNLLTDFQPVVHHVSSRFVVGLVRQ